MTAKKTFDWRKPVVGEAPKAPGDPGPQTMRRLKEQKPAKPAKSNLTQEYNAFVNRRRGVR